MPERVQMRRRARGAGLRGLLVERDDELAVVERQLADARAGSGGVLLLEAFAGKGKSRLLTIAGDLAREAGMQVLGAHGSALERDFPFGVAVQLFEPRWMAAEEAEQKRLLEGPARQAERLLSGALSEQGHSAGDHSYAVIHGLLWLATNLALPPDGVAGGPLAVLVDDAHWADGPSLRFLAYLAERIGDLPIALVIALRPGESVADRQALGAIRQAAEENVLRPGALSEEGVAAVVRTEFPDADDDFCAACARVTSGNPFLLVELLGQLRADQAEPASETAARLAELAPESVLNTIVARLGAMSPAAGRVASAVAILGDGASLRQVARLAGLDMGEASQAANPLAAMHIFHPGSPLSFVHPLVASAVRASMSPLDRGEGHRRAAAILAEERASEEQIAAHLLAAPPAADPHAVEVLRAAARRALASGAAETAVRLLRRGLAEHPADDIYPEVLAELGQAESAAGLPQAVQRLEQAIQATGDTPRRAELALAQGIALYDQKRFRDSAGVVKTALEDLGEEDGGDASLADELNATYIAAASFVPELTEEARVLGDRLLARITEEPTPAQRNALAHMAVHRSLHGEERAAVRQLVDLAWGDGLLLEQETSDGLTWPLLTAALLFLDELERDLEICDDVLAAARQQDSPAAFAAASYCRAWPLYEQGCIVDAAADAKAALDARPDPWRTYVRTAYGAIACCHVMRGEPEHAETALSILEHRDVRDSMHLPFLLDARAQLRLAQHRPEEALADALEAGRRHQSDWGADSPGAIAWRSTAALAHVALGQRARALEFAAEELEQARRVGVTRVVIRALRISGLAEQGERRLERLEEAVHVADAYPQRLESIQALIDYGAALRRANRRADAREPLRRALEMSHHGGATALTELARTELTATGARPRRAMLSGIESLTPSERRVADMAAKGLTTRQIGEALFVTPKTVEFHLRHIYQKLDISSRSQLSEVLGEANQGD